MGKKWIYLFIAIILIPVIIYYTYRQKFTITKILKGSDGISYGITSKFGIEKKLNRFVEIRKRINKLVEYCKENDYPDVNRSHRLVERWENANLGETNPLDDTVAFVVDKGREFKVCLTDKETNELESLNSTMFVALHEVSHLMSKEWGHGTEFWENFRIILELSIKLGIYEYRNFQNKPDNFCGTVIYSEPCNNSTCTK